MGRLRKIASTAAASFVALGLPVLGQQSDEELSAQRQPEPLPQSQWQRPWAQLKFVSFQPAIFPRMLGEVSSDARPASEWKSRGHLVLEHAEEPDDHASW